MPSVRHDTRLAAYAVIVDDRDRVLLALWNEGPTPRWTMPGGGVELHESSAEAAVREVREETGYEVALGPLLGIDTVVIPAADRLGSPALPLQSVRVLYVAAITGGRLTNEIDGTTDEARWFALEEIASLDRVGLVDVALKLWWAASTA
jgi:8-oxo-dGTP diphosphatase